MQRFLAHSERSSGQLHSKVLLLGYPVSVAENTVEWAIEFGLIDDLRFCHIYISSRTMGKRRLKMELSRKKVPEAVVAEVLSTISEKESSDELVKQVSRRYGTIEDNETARRRASAWLARRGFSSEVIHAVLKEAL